MTQIPVPIGLLETALRSEHVAALIAGEGAHDAALRFVAQIAPFTNDPAWVTAIVRAALPANYTGNTLSEIPAMLTSAAEKGLGGQVDRKEDKASKSAIIAASRGTELVADEHGDAHLGLPLATGGRIFHGIRSTLVKAFVRRAYFRAKGKALPKEALAETLDTLEASALFDKPRVGLSLRLGCAPDGAIFLDPGWPEGGFIHITSEGWLIEDTSPVRFRRPPGLSPMPRPERGGSLADLKSLLSLDDRNWALLIGFMINCLRPQGPYMFLLVEGEQGSGKSLLSTIVKRIGVRLCGPARATGTRRGPAGQGTGTYTIVTSVTEVPGHRPTVPRPASRGLRPFNPSYFAIPESTSGCVSEYSLGSVWALRLQPWSLRGCRSAVRKIVADVLACFCLL